MAEGRLARKLAAVLCADVAGDSRLVGEDEEGTRNTGSVWTLRAHPETAFAQTPRGLDGFRKESSGIRISGLARRPT